MFPLRKPSEAYDRVSLDARIAGSDPRQLTTLCLDRAIQSLGLALAADRIAAVQRRGEALGHCLNALGALILGIDRAAPLSAVLGDFYEGLRFTISQSLRNFDVASIETARADLRDVANSLRSH